MTAKYLYDDTIDETGKSLVIDWYYKKRSGGRTVLHYAKLVGDHGFVRIGKLTTDIASGGFTTTGGIPLCLTRSFRWRAPGGLWVHRCDEGYPDVH